MSGTDYLKTNKNVYYYLNCYKKSRYMEFDKWLQIHNNLSDEKYKKIMNILDIYQNLDKELKNYPYFVIRSDRIDKEKLFKLLERERFVFV